MFTKPTLTLFIFPLLCGIWVLFSCGENVSNPFIKPYQLEYKNQEIMLTVGQAVVIDTPLAGGQTPLTFKIIPALPSGLVFNTANGGITGTPKDTLMKTEFDVTVSNSAGSLVSPIFITILPAAPSQLQYASNNVVYNVNTTVLGATPTFSGGTPTQYIITPALPAGLQLDEKKGNIYGIPTTELLKTQFIVTGTNVSGSARDTLFITIELAASSDTTAAMPPTGLNVTNANEKTILLMWNKTKNANAYIVFRSTNADNGFVPIDTVSKDTSFTDTTLNTAYYYYVVSQNAKGVLSLPSPKTFSVALAITTVPKWQSNPTNLVVVQGNAITLNLADKYSGDSVSTTLLSGLPTGDTLVANTYSFTATLTDTNSYTPKIVAKNSHGADTLIIKLTVTSKIDTVAVDTIAPTIKKISGPLTNAILKDSVLTIVDSIYDASGIDSVYWLLNGVRVAQLTKDANNHYVVTTNLNTFHKNTVVVIASDKSKAKNTKADTTIIDYAPKAKIISQPQNQSVVSGQPASFTVTAFGPDLQYQWQKGTIDIANATLATFSLSTTTLTDSGTSYRCIVSNIAGKDTSRSTLLTVSALIIAPAITTQPVNQSVVEGQAATFTIVATGTSITYQWLKNGVDIASANAASYITPLTTPLDSGSKFTCITGNASGKDTSTVAILSVNSLPKAPTISTISTGDSSATITWGMVTGATSYNLYYHSGTTVSKLTGTLVSGATSPKTIKGLTNGTEYAFAIVAVNANGESVFSSIMTATPQVYAITASVSGSGGTITPLGNIRVIGGKDTTFTFASAIGYTLDSVLIDGVYDAGAKSAKLYKFTNVTTAHSIRLRFAIKKYTLTTSINADVSGITGSITQNPTGTLFDSNTTVQLTPPSDVKYNFTGWSGGATGNANPLSVTMNADKAITANYTIKKFTITFNYRDGRANGSQQVTYGNKATKRTDTTRTGYFFNGWYLDSSFANAWDFNANVTANDTLFAKWIIMDIDGNVYTEVKIGTQTWMVENLKTTRFNDGTGIPKITNDSIWIDASTNEAFCYYNNTSNVDSIKKFGALYNWYAVGTKKLAPVGWHVPDTTEWNTLENYMIANGFNWDGTKTGNKIGRSLAANIDWIPSATIGSVGNSLPANNKSAFSALPSGGRWNFGFYSSLGIDCFWWTSIGTLYRSLNYDLEYLKRSYALTANYGLSVRLIRDN